MKKVSSFLLFIFISAGGGMSSGTLAPFSSADDVGNCRFKGQTVYDPVTQTFIIGGSGRNMWFKEDEFHFVWKKMSGNFILTARFAFIGQGVNPHRKTGWMIRTALTPDSPYADAVVHGDGLTSLQFRRAFGNDTEEIK
ncbi:MAG: biopolymer transporter TolR, partial [candidate division KSB1 bacterium]|nr:biopolymer transporter TolR [candidate division KSB1 bacterium]